MPPAWIIREGSSQAVQCREIPDQPAQPGVVDVIEQRVEDDARDGLTLGFDAPADKTVVVSLVGKGENPDP